MATITSLETLRALYGEPSEKSVKKVLHRLERHARAFIARSPFVLIGSSAPGRLPDVSPKGDIPGFVRVLDDETIAIPDRPGNNRLDTYENVLLNPAVGLLFLIPGMDETLRINGRAEIRDDADLLDSLAHEGRRPVTALVVKADEVFLHCAKAFMRSALWDPASRIDRATMPTLGEMLKDQIAASETAEAIDDRLAEVYRTTLY